MFDFKIDGIESIDTDFTNFQRKVNKGINYGLKAFASELTPTLQKHIVDDVYKEYDPESYERRYDNPQYGRSIYSDKNMSWNLVYHGAGEQGVEFTYEPNGKNTHYPRSDYWLYGDDIIATIQQDDGYLWLKDGSIGKQRPFWNKFIQEVGAKGDDWFVQGFNKFDHDLHAETDGNITEKTSDYKVERTGALKHFD